MRGNVLTEYLLILLAIVSLMAVIELITGKIHVYSRHYTDSVARPVL